MTLIWFFPIEIYDINLTNLMDVEVSRYELESNSTLTINLTHVFN